MSTGNLVELLENSARRFPDKIAVAMPGGGSISYRELSRLSDRLRDRLHRIGVRHGDRVGFRLHKSIDSVVTLFGVMKAGAAYVPVDADSPAARGAYILNDCQVRAVVTEESLAEALETELRRLGATPHMISLRPSAEGLPIAHTLDMLDVETAPAVATPAISLEDIAYILYTSGSTGQPKGVVLTHGNALSFIDWVSDTFQPNFDDVFSSHAPFHFDLSILDIYVPLKHGARLVLINEPLGKDPLKLAAAIGSERISVWYSTPSILSLLADYGKLDRHDCSQLRIVFFAGEVFPIPRFRNLRTFWPKPRFVNLYGPTETNVCTYYEVPAGDSWKAFDTFPIGTICVPNKGRVVDEEGTDVTPGTPGELVVAGPNVMRGYWNLPEHNARAFFHTPDGRQWYRTGDIVVEEAGASYRYLSRRDRMVKRRGYRVELGEIEVALNKHPDVREGAVVAIPDAESGVRIGAFVSCAEDRRLTIIALKTFCSQNLPPYMIPDTFMVVDAMPRTSTDKIDYQALKARA
jgi:amino acid adenylation domain-containing protein